MRPDSDEYATVDPAVYERSMASERRTAARALVREVKKAGATGPLLDVGCSFGWMLEAALREGFDAYGVDPSAAAVESARSRGLNVRRGHFPVEDWGGASWGVISYLDVLEHIEDLDEVLTDTRARLRPDGFLAVQVPVSTGAVYAAASLLERVTLGRFDGPIRRMLQLDFPYPHLHYFCASSIGRLLARFSFEIVHCAEEPIATGDLTDRVSWSQTVTAAQRLQAVGLGVLLRSGRILKRNDILRLVARRIG